MSRKLIWILLLLTLSCQRPPSQIRATPDPPNFFGILPSPALVLELNPQSLGAMIQSLESHLQNTPLQKAWNALYSKAKSLIHSLTSKRLYSDFSLHHWGIDPQKNLLLSINSPNGAEIGRAQMALLQNRAPSLENQLTFHARAVFFLHPQGEQTFESLFRQIAHQLDLQPRSISPELKDLLNVHALYQSAQSGLLMSLRRQNLQIAIDVLLPAKAKNDPEHFSSEWNAGVSPLSSAQLFEITLFPAQIAALETALSAHEALRRIDWPKGPERTQLFENYAELTAECTSRWIASAQLADRITLSINAGTCSTDDDRPKLYACPELTLDAELTEWGKASWQGSLGVLIGDEPELAGYRLAVSRNAFLQISSLKRSQNLKWWNELSLCKLGPLRHLAAWPLLPAFAEPQNLPLIEPPLGFPRDPIGFRAEILGATVFLGQSFPNLLSAVALESAPQLVQPLGESATLSKTEHQIDWHVEGAYPAHLQMNLSSVPTMIFTLGHSTALQDLKLQSTRAEEGLFLDATLKPKALAHVLGDSDPAEDDYSRALRQLGENWSEFVLQGSLGPKTLHLLFYPLMPDSTSFSAPSLAP